MFAKLFFTLTFQNIENIKECSWVIGGNRRLILVGYTKTIARFPYVIMSFQYFLSA